MAKQQTVTNPEQYRGRTVAVVDFNGENRQIIEQPRTRAELRELMLGSRTEYGSSVWDNLTERQVSYEVFGKTDIRIYAYTKNQQTLEYDRTEHSGYATKQEAREAALDFMMTGNVTPPKK